MDDLKDCEAKQVYILSDQSYAGELVNAFSQSKHHSNVIIIGSGKNDEYSWNNEFVKHWTSYRHTHKCITQVHEVSVQFEIKGSQLVVRVSHKGLRTTALNPLNT